MSRPLFLGIANTTYEVIYLNNNINCQLKKKAELILPIQPIYQASSRACDALLQPLTYDISGSLIGFTESQIDAKHDLEFKSLL